MKEGDIVLAELPQGNDFKLRPALVLKVVPPFGDFLLCGVSTQLDLEVAGFDERISEKDGDFSDSRLKQTSLIRLGFLVVLPRSEIAGKLGFISPERHKRLIERLSHFLLS